MKFTAAFALLTVFAAKAFAAAGPAPAYGSLFDPRSEFTESAVEDVLSRFYNQVVDDLEARHYYEDIFERVSMRNAEWAKARRILANDDDYLAVRAQKAAKEFAEDLGIGLGQKVPGFVQQYKKAKEAKVANQVRNKHNSPAHRIEKKKPKKAVSPPRTAFVKVPLESKPKSIKKKPSVMEELKKAGKI
ncbi:hypothetical protein BKA70DRAFT_408096 [Coprinopsis sp. MPI-PUGE-AT-0042]|nr:hypothetical protein BKA70DRAFT_408096 [Coprinopsis sp. MPI-PUGE-AT-0042]